MKRAGKFLAFCLENEYYAVEMESAVEIMRVCEITRIPLAPPFVKGVINLRGSIVPLLDLKVKFGFGQKEYGEKACIIIIETVSDGKKKLAGILADTVLEVLEIVPDEIKKPPQAINSEYIKGIFSALDKTFWLLELDNALSFDDANLND